MEMRKSGLIPITPALTPESNPYFYDARGLGAQLYAALGGDALRDRLESVPATTAGGRAGNTFVSAAAAFEAFDAPWKADALHNPIEGRWGLMSIERVPYPAFRVWVDARPAGR